MKCKYCNEEMPERGHFCPICGGDNSVESEQIVVDPEEMLRAVDALSQQDEAEDCYLNEDEAWVDEDEEWDEEDEEEEGEEEEEYHEPSPELKRARLFSAVTGCVALLALLGVVLFAGISGSFSEDGNGWNISSLFDWIIPRDNNVKYKDSYTVSDKKAVNNRKKEVASVPGAALTNGELQIYYWSQVYDFLKNNSYYLSYLGLDYTSPLDGQAAYDGSGTWQQYFLEGALNMWHSNIAFAMQAKAEGFQMSAEDRKTLDGLRTELEAQALKDGYASADAMLQNSMGPGCTVDDYLSYMEVYYLAYSYFAEKYSAIDPTMEQIEAYYEANKAAMEKEGIKKDGSYTVDIRHILIKIEELKVEGDGTQTQDEGQEGESTEETLIDGYTQAAWDACKAKAEAILEQWLNGEMTEDSFAELAKTNSADGNASSGGIYTGVKKGDMVESFDEWCFAEEREGGHYGLVRTKYGYHIMYFVAKEDIWVTQSRSKIISEASAKLVSDALEAYPMEVVYKKIVLGEVKL